ncbi:E3 SUMO-protein ligase ZBED1 [Halyomorpha halys]|uniref:E3 SUMO-protein ligase ZBED1 n=1 Tax=Halyomorpha halys TaxID=286706 RepID=UPI0006D52195
MTPPKSKVWQFFMKIDKKTARCKECFKTVQTSGNTSNLTKHLKTHTHGHQKSSDCEASTSTASTSRPSQQSSTTKSTTSSSLLSAFQKTSSYTAGGSKHGAITNCLLYFICADQRPFDIVKGRGFKKLTKELAPLYTLPSVDTLKARLNEKYSALHCLYKEKFQTIPYFSITCDVWTNTMTCRSFLGVTVHFIQSLRLNTVNIAVKPLSEQHTGEYLGDQLVKILDDWGINKKKIVAVITDNGANIVAAVNIVFGKGKHIPCFAHTLNLVAESVLKHPEASVIVEKVREVVKFVKNSVNITDEIRRKQIEEGGIPEDKVKKIILDVKTRWNSTFYMLERFVELSRMLNEILLEKPHAPPMPTALELQLVKDIMSLMQPLEHMTREASGELYITISKVIPMVNCVINRYHNISFGSENINAIKLYLMQQLEKRFGKIEHVKSLSVSTILDPRFKSIHLKDPVAVANAVS